MAADQFGDTSPPKGLGALIVQVLVDRIGQPTIVLMADGEELMVHGIAWGLDLGDRWEHVTTNYSPPIDDCEVDFFFVSDVVRVVDPDTRKVLIQQEPCPGER